MAQGISIIEALINHLPKSITAPDGESIAIYWHPEGEKVPESKKNVPVVGLISVLDGVPRGKFRNLADPTLIPTEQTDNFTYVTGTDDYVVSERDIDSVTSVTGSVSGAFTENDDYTFDEDSITFVAAPVTPPQNGETITVVYDHRLYQPMSEMASTFVFKLRLRVKQTETAQREWLKTVLAEVAGNQISDYLRANPGVPAPFPGDSSSGLMVEKILRSGRSSFDEGFSVAIWNIDVRVKRLSQHETGDPARLVRDTTDVSGTIV